MTTSSVHLFDHAVQGAALWIEELAEELGVDDRRHARRVLRAVLHTIRDRLDVHESAQLAAQLPELIRGMYFEGWVPERKAPRQRQAFLQALAEAAGLHGPTEASFALGATMAVLRRHVSEGELRDVHAAMPAELRELLDA